MSTRCLAVAVVLLLIAGLAAFPAQAQEGEVPHMISFQGQLVVEGQPLSGSERLVFRFYDRPDGGSPLAGWEEDRTVGVENGIFSVLLGEQTALPDELFEENGPVYLSVTTGDAEVRLPLSSAPFALRAELADRSKRAEVAEEAERLQAGAISSGALEDGSITADKLAGGVAVLSLNDLTEEVELVAGSNISIESNEQAGTIEIASDASGESGLSSVSTDNTISGDGTSGSPLGLASGVAVRTLNGLSDEVTLEAGANVDLDVSGGAIRISAEPTGGGGESGVSSLNELTDEVEIVGGRQIEISVEDQEIRIDRVGNGGPPSSRRYKEDIQPLVEALSVVEQLEGVTFSWKADGRGDIGLIAEEVEQVLPQVVHYDDNERIEGVRYDSMVALLVEAIKEQQSTIAALEEQMTDQQRRLERLERRLGEEQLDDE